MRKLVEKLLSRDLGLHFAPLHSPLSLARVKSLGWPTGPGRCGCCLRLTILTFHFAKCSSNLFYFSILVSSSDLLSTAAGEEAQFAQSCGARFLTIYRPVLGRFMSIRVHCILTANVAGKLAFYEVLCWSLTWTSCSRSLLCYRISIRVYFILLLNTCRLCVIYPLGKWEIQIC